MMDRLLFVHAGIHTPLPVQAMLTAVMAGREDMAGAVGMECLVANCLMKVFRDFSAVCFYDVLPIAVPEPFRRIISERSNVMWFYSAGFSSAYSTTLGCWHEANDVPCWSEGNSSTMVNVASARPILFPSIRLEDSSPFNPVRLGGQKTRVGVFCPPATDIRMRELQREFLDSKSYSFLSMLEPASRMRDLCERFFGFDVFYAPGENGQPHWNFDLSCMLAAGARVCGFVPEVVRTFCLEAVSLDEAIRQGNVAGNKTIDYDKKIETSLRHIFLEMLSNAMETTK